MGKLTLSVDEEVVARAKRYAKAHGVSISEMVEAYLAAVASPEHPAERASSLLRSLTGILQNANSEDYTKHLEKKYR